MSAVPTIGILMLATRFPRPVGDIGNPASFDCPVLTETIAPATPERVVRGDPSALLPLFTEAGHRLVRRGATLVSTSCGFLTRFQDELSGALLVPVLTSSLFAAARLDAPAIMTIDAAALTPVHLAAARVPAGTPVGGMDARRSPTPSCWMRSIWTWRGPARSMSSAPAPSSPRTPRRETSCWSAPIWVRMPMPSARRRVPGSTPSWTC